MTAEEHLAKWFRKSEQASPARIPQLDRKRLVELFGEWGLKLGAEVGVDGGTFAEYMFKVNPGLELIGVDPWARDESDAKHKRALQLLKGKAWTRLHMTSEQAYLHVPDGSLDFVYIDGDHTFDFVMLDLILWSRKVRPGGIVSGHDYYRFRTAGVVPAVDVYTHAHGIHEWFLTSERTPSFFWLKP